MNDLKSENKRSGRKDALNFEHHSKWKDRLAIIRHGQPHELELGERLDSKI